MQGFFHPLFPVPAVLVLDGSLQFVQVAFAVRVLLDPGDDIGHAGACRLEHGRIGVEQRFLGDIRDLDTSLELQHAVVGLFQPCQDFQHGRLASAVASDQADALAGLE